MTEKIEMEDLRIRTKKRTTCSTLYFISWDLECGKVKQMQCHIRRQMFIQYPTNVIFKVLASVSGDYFTGEQAEVGK